MAKIDDYRSLFSAPPAKPTPTAIKDAHEDKFLAEIEQRTSEIRNFPPPVGTNEAIQKVIHLTSGLSPEVFRWAVDSSVNWYELHGTMPTHLEAIREYAGLWPDKPMIERIWVDEFFHQACYLRGIRPKGAGLDSRQLLLISALTNVTDRRLLENKLRSLGVSQLEYQTWMAFPPFKRKYNELAEKAFHNATSLVNTALTQKALTGSVEAIKLHNQMTGRYDPAAQQAVDVRAFAMGIVQILTKHITDPDLLRTLGGDIALLSAAMGVNTRSVE